MLLSCVLFYSLVVFRTFSLILSTLQIQVLSAFSLILVVDTGVVTVLYTCKLAVSYLPIG